MDGILKRLVKQIVMSATYRQSAEITAEKLKKILKIFISLMHRGISMQAEFVRDIVLSSSGLLNKTIGGPSVKPYQPKGLWEAATSGRGILSTIQTGYRVILYRRGMYTFIKRTVPPPSHDDLRCKQS